MDIKKILTGLFFTSSSLCHGSVSTHDITPYALFHDMFSQGGLLEIWLGDTPNKELGLD